MAKGKAQDLFRSKSPVIMARLLRDIPSWTPMDAAADLGNLGQESAGFTLLQEQKPTVAGSQGGFGWYQWTGPRRRAYMAWCKKNGLNPAGDDANYGFHIFELKGEYKAVIPAVRAAKGLEAKVKAFERAYERAGTPHYSSRNQWAAIALEAWDAINTPPAPKPEPKPPAPVVVEKPVVADPGELHKPVTRSKTFWTWLLTAIGAPFAAFGNLDWRVQLAIVAIIVAFAIYGITRRAQLAQAVRDLKSEIGQ
ncbi:phage tail tip lysozyme [Mesorhizobium sp. M1399]|uniref:phage tail tip lysozyme n=1 Tax=Mesorhizobium sp. M1399 TaxID=2957096 RepID=UPI00333704AB